MSQGVEGDNCGSSLWILDVVTHRMVDSPHKHAEQRVAGTEELHFLSHEVLFLRLRFARNS